MYIIIPKTQNILCKETVKVDKLKWNIKICSNNSKGERKWKQKK
jgi:hypothetical protein